jgi:hypothetical protein
MRSSQTPARATSGRASPLQYPVVALGDHHHAGTAGTNAQTAKVSLTILMVPHDAIIR